MCKAIILGSLTDLEVMPFIGRTGDVMSIHDGKVMVKFHTGDTHTFHREEVRICYGNPVITSGYSLSDMISDVNDLNRLKRAKIKLDAWQEDWLAWAGDKLYDWSD